MTTAQRERLIQRHDQLIDVEDLTDEVLEEIALIEMVLLADPDGPVHQCGDPDCLSWGDIECSK